MILVALISLVGLVVLARAIFKDPRTPQQRAVTYKDCVYCHGTSVYRYESGREGPCPEHGRHNTNRRLVD